MNRATLAETYRRNVTSSGFIIFVVLAGLIAAGSSQANGADPSFVYVLIGLLSYVFGAQLIGPEFSSGTLQLIIAKPVNRSSYVLSRFAGVVLSIWTALWFQVAIYGILRTFNQGNPVDWSRLGGATVNVSLDVMLICALMTLFGCMTRSYFNAAIYFFLYFGLSMAIGVLRVIRGAGGGFLGTVARFVEAHPGVTSVLTGAQRNLFSDPPAGGLERDWALMVLSNVALALLLSCAIFRLREVPYGAD